MKQGKLSARIILDKILRDPIFNGIQLEAILDWLVDFYQIVGIPEMFERKFIKDININEYKVELPSDFKSEVSIEVNGVQARRSTDPNAPWYELIVGDASGSSINITTENMLWGPGGYNDPVNGIVQNNAVSAENPPVNQNGEIDLSTSFDAGITFEINSAEYPRPVQQDKRLPVDLVYEIRGNILYLSRLTGKVSITYDAISTDVDGVPEIPDNPLFIKAFRLYCEKEWMKRLWRSGKISDKAFEDVKQEYAWSIGQYEADTKALTPGDAETFFKQGRSLMVRQNDHRTRFKNMPLK